MRHLSFFGVLALVALSACTKPEPAVDPVRAVRVVTVAAQSTGGTQEFAAEIRPRIESRLGFRVGGKMLRRLVNVGDTVAPGQLLAELDPQDLRLGQDAARAATASAEVNFQQSAADYKRYKDLRAQGFISSADLERRETSLKAAQAQLDQARAQASVQGNQAAYARLVADAGGVITAVDLEPGMVVAAGGSVVRLAHNGPRDAVFAVPEDKVDLIKAQAAQAGQIEVRLWGANAAPIPASLREISAAADAATRTFQVKADIGNAPGVRIGQTATVVVDLPKLAGITKLPLSALREEQGKTHVWVVDQASMTVKSLPVQLAGAEGNDAVITAGLAPGQVVVTAGVHVLTPGQKVKFYVDPGAAPAAAAQAASETQVTVR